MAVKIRLKRMGAKKRPYYRIVVADSRSPRDGRFIEAIGTYDPIMKDSPVTIDDEKITKWLKNGAQPTDTVKSILRSAGVYSKLNVTKASKPKKEVIKKEAIKKEVIKKEVVTKEEPAKKVVKKTTTKKSGK